MTVNYNIKTLLFVLLILGSSLGLRSQSVYSVRAALQDILTPKTADQPKTANQPNINSTNEEQSSFEFIFRHDKVTIDEDYRDNLKTKIELRNFINSGIKIDSIIIHASASLEGYVKHNDRLARERAAALKTLITETSVKELNDSLFRLYPIGEDWEGFHSFIEEYYYRPDRNEVLSILDSDMSQTDKKWLLQKLSNGQTFSYLTYNFAYRFRQANCIIIYYAGKSVQVKEERLPELEQFKDSLSHTTSYEIPRPEYTKPERKQTVFALKTNLLFDALTTINYSLEVPIGDRISVLFQQNTPWWRAKNNQFCNETLTLGGEVRYWLGDRRQMDRLTGHNIGVYCFSGDIDLQWKRNICYQAVFVSAGLSYGFALPISNWANLEFSIAAGWARIYYQHYMPADDWSVIYRDYNDFGAMNYFGPTKLEISLVIPIKAIIGGKR